MIDVREFVPRDSLYLLESSAQAEFLRASGMLVYSRGELRASMADVFLQYAGLYHLFQVSNALQVCVADEQALRVLPAEAREVLLQEQVRLNRGYVFDAEWLASLGEEFAEESKHLLETSGVSVEGRRFVVLTREIWDGLRAEFRQAWFEQQVAQLAAQYPQETLPEDFEWSERISEGQRALIRQYAGRTAERSGPNCFAGAIGAAAGTSASHAILRQWLHPEPFWRMLADLGYVRVEANVQAGDVLVWRGRDEEAIHAAFVIDEGLLFQKHGQHWFDPWMVVKFATVEDYAESVSSGGRIEVYRREA
ncbi:hypothetical protein [Tumebacillus flagellatus]|uniref:Uncharacterized protein n=1 Tax=Tumebacillus flagellatus TaxID=1157490 RepID=A0A074LP10_9BACL|nr:hypothetical protein [Tumebacillus flagellatus]KEO83906.1 hypothetical protein EL26_06880 [Tumebacillus flagellatus]